MITILIAAGAGVGGVLLGCGWCIWRVSRRFTLQARPVEPLKLPKSAQAGDMLIEVHSQSKHIGGAGDEPRGDASADYEPRHESDPLAYFRPLIAAATEARDRGQPFHLTFHEERYPARHSDLDAPDVREDRAIAITTEDANKWAFASPDCRVGKHTACSGDAWDDHTDRQINCACPCHTEGLH